MSRIGTSEDPAKIEDNLLDAHLFQIEVLSFDLAYNSQLLEEGQALEGMSDKNKKIRVTKVASYTIVNIFLYKIGLDDVLRRCVLENERENVINEAQYGPAGDHFQADTTTIKIQQS